MINSVVLVGRLTKDVEVRTTSTGTTVGKFTLAVNRMTKKAGQPDADFITCKSFNKTNDILEKYTRKGSQIGVEGRIQTGSYQNSKGDKVYTTDVIVNNVMLLDSKNASQSQGNGGGYQESMNPYNRPQNVQNGPTNGNTGLKNYAHDGYYSNDTLDITDEDLPF